MIEWLDSLDTWLFLSLNSLHSPFWDGFMSLFSGKWIWIPLYATILLVMAKNLRWQQTLIAVVAVALTIALSDQICASVIRPIVERPRPANLANPIAQFTHIVDGYRGGLYGFPSCHAANSFVLALFVALFFRNRLMTATFFTWAFVNSYSRIYLGVHYPGDLFVGAAVGMSAACLMARLARRYSGRFACNHPIPAPSDLKMTTSPLYAFAGTIMAIILLAALSHA